MMSERDALNRKKGRERVKEEIAWKSSCEIGE
jgi:hypothetical protein